MKEFSFPYNQYGIRTKRKVLVAVIKGIMKNTKLFSYFLKNLILKKSFSKRRSVATIRKGTAYG
jgi:hypothetical protein